MGYERKVYIEIDMDAVIDRVCPGRPAKLYGPPESCYPAEDAEIEFSLFRNGKEVDTALFTAEEMDNLTAQVIEAYESEMEAKIEDRR